jgi:hypothetical protein
MDMRRSLGLRVAVAAVAALGMIATANASQNTSNAVEQSSIESVVLASQVAEQTLMVPPASYQNGNGIPAAAVATMKANIHSALGRYYAGGLASRLESVIGTNAAAQAAGTGVTLGGGVTSITFPSVEIDGTTATVHAQAMEYARFGFRKANGGMTIANPTDLIDITDTLENTASGWHIVDESRDFAPGYGP